MPTAPDLANSPSVELIIGTQRLSVTPKADDLINWLAISRDDSDSDQTWSQLVDDLLDVRNLENDWDGQGSKAPPPALVDGAITLARLFQASRIAPADFAVAGVNGTVLFEWRRPDRYLEIEMTAPDSAEGRSVRKNVNVTEVFTLTIRG